MRMWASTARTSWGSWHGIQLHDRRASKKEGAAQIPFRLDLPGGDEAAPDTPGASSSGVRAFRRRCFSATSAISSLIAKASRPKRSRRCSTSIFRRWSKSSTSMAAKSTSSSATRCWRCFMPRTSEHDWLRLPGGASRHPSATALRRSTARWRCASGSAEFNQRRKAAGKATIETGVGITHGEIISGPIGSKDRMDFTVIGDVVNLAAASKSSPKAAAHQDHFLAAGRGKGAGPARLRPMPGEKVKGKEEAGLTFELVGVKESGISWITCAPRIWPCGAERGAARALAKSGGARLGDRRAGRQRRGTRLQAVLSVAKLAKPGG